MPRGSCQLARQETQMFLSLIDCSSQLGPLVGRSESLRTPTSSATKEMNKVMGRLRRGSSFKGDDLENFANGGPGGSMAGQGSGSRLKSGPVPVPSPWGGLLRPRDCSPAFTRLGNSAENSPEGSLPRYQVQSSLSESFEAKFIYKITTNSLASRRQRIGGIFCSQQ